jgi:hypothetical protein
MSGASLTTGYVPMTRNARDTSEKRCATAHFLPAALAVPSFAALLRVRVVLSGVMAVLAGPAVSGNRRTEAGIPRRCGHRLCLSSRELPASDRPNPA